MTMLTDQSGLQSASTAEIQLIPHFEMPSPQALIGGALNVSSFAVRYDWGGAANADAAAASLAGVDSDLLIMEAQYAINTGADQAFTAAQIAQIEAGPGGKTVVGYMSIGSIQDQRDRYLNFQDAVVASSGHEKWLAYWDPAHVEACNTALLDQYKAWISDMIGQGLNGAFLDVIDSYWRPDVQAAIGGGSIADDIQIATTAILTIIRELDIYARSLDPDFKLVLGHNPDLILNYFFPGGANPNPDQALVAAVQAAVDGVLTESVNFSDPSNSETQRIVANLAQGSPYNFGDATLMALGYFDDGGSFGDGEAATWAALHYQINAALLGFVPYATANAANAEGFGQTYPIFDVATSGPNALLTGTDGGKLNGKAGDDLVVGRGGADKLIGGGGDDEVHGGAGADRLLGVGGADTLDGGDGADTLTGGRGQDSMTGGAGADHFSFLATSDSDKVQRADYITDLSAGDVIDLSAVDADELQAGDQAFHKVGHFSGHAGELVLTYRAGEDLTLLRADTDGDGKADLIIQLDGDQSGFLGLVL